MYFSHRIERVQQVQRWVLAKLQLLQNRTLNGSDGCALFYLHRSIANHDVDVYEWMILHLQRCLRRARNLASSRRCCMSCMRWILRTRFCLIWVLFSSMALQHVLDLSWALLLECRLKGLGWSFMCLNAISILSVIAVLARSFPHERR